MQEEHATAAARSGRATECCCGDLAGEQPERAGMGNAGGGWRWRTDRVKQARQKHKRAVGQADGPRGLEAPAGNEIRGTEDDAKAPGSFNAVSASVRSGGWPQREPGCTAGRTDASRWS